MILSCSIAIVMFIYSNDYFIINIIILTIKLPVSLNWNTKIFFILLVKSFVIPSSYISIFVL